MSVWCKNFQKEAEIKMVPNDSLLRLRMETRFSNLLHLFSKMALRIFDSRLTERNRK